MALIMWTAVCVNVVVDKVKSEPKVRRDGWK